MEVENEQQAGGAPYGNRTRVSAVKGSIPVPWRTQAAAKKRE
jgi:hypothetical protein